MMAGITTVHTPREEKTVGGNEAKTGMADEREFECLLGERRIGFPGRFNGAVTGTISKQTQTDRRPRRLGDVNKDCITSPPCARDLRVLLCLRCSNHSRNFPGQAQHESIYISNKPPHSCNCSPGMSIKLPDSAIWIAEKAPTFRGGGHFFTPEIAGNLRVIIRKPAISTTVCYY